MKHGLRLWNEGADVVDIGGESTRPGAARIDERVELDRVLPVVAELARNGVKVSIDTTRASVAKACIEAGAWMINDVSGGLSDSTMLRVIADVEAPRLSPSVVTVCNGYEHKPSQHLDKTLAHLHLEWVSPSVTPRFTG